MPKYIEWVVANARKFEEVELDVKGETDEELAASLVAEMLPHRAHLADVGHRPPSARRPEGTRNLATIPTARKDIGNRRSWPC